MKKLEIVKVGLELLASMGVGTLVGGGVNLVKPANLNRFKSISVVIAGFALSNMISDKTTEYIDTKWNEVTTQIKGRIKRINNIIKTSKEEA